jgi:hypothetical protein
LGNSVRQPPSNARTVPHCGEHLARDTGHWWQLQSEKLDSRKLELRKGLANNGDGMTCSRQWLKFLEEMPRDRLTLGLGHCRHEHQKTLLDLGAHHERISSISPTLAYVAFQLAIVQPIIQCDLLIGGPSLYDQDAGSTFMPLRMSAPSLATMI